MTLHVDKTIQAVLGVGLVCGLLLSSAWGEPSREANPKVSVDVRNMPVSFVLEEMSAQSGMRIVCTAEWLNGFPVTVQWTQKDVVCAVRELLGDLDYTLVCDRDAANKLIGIQIDVQVSGEESTEEAHGELLPAQSRMAPVDMQAPLPDADSVEQLVGTVLPPSGRKAH